MPKFIKMVREDVKNERIQMNRILQQQELDRQIQEKLDRDKRKVHVSGLKPQMPVSKKTHITKRRQKKKDLSEEQENIIRYLGFHLENEAENKTQN